MKTLCTILIFLIGIYGFGQKIKTKKRIIDDTVHIDFVNPYHAPIEFQMSVKDTFQKQIIIKESVKIPPLSIIKDALIYPESMIKESTKSIIEYLNIKGSYGYKEVIMPDYDFKYLLPYPKGKKYKIIQTFGGKFSHSQAHSLHAVDFSLQVGDTIMASRAGKVVFVKEDSKEYGGRKFMGKANKIIVMHTDGTFAHYVHLGFNQAFVQEGEWINEDQPIGLVGMSGFTTTPHLHFVVIKEGSTSIPIVYRGVEDKVLKKNKKYKRTE